MFLINGIIHQPALSLRYNRSFSHRRKAKISIFFNDQRNVWVFFKGDGGTGWGVIPTVWYVVLTPPYFYHYKCLFIYSKCFNILRIYVEIILNNFTCDLFNCSGLHLACVKLRKTGGNFFPFLQVDTSLI